MNISQLKVVLREVITRTNLTPCVVGHRGVGKTAAIFQVCKEIDFAYTPLRLGQMEVGDLVGMPYRTGDVMHWSRPSWWPQADARPTLVHCDELNRAQQEDTLQAIFQFIEPPGPGQHRALHTHVLAPQHRVVVAINPPDGSYQVAPLDRALLDRMLVLQVESDADCWGQYALEQNFDDQVRHFIAGNQAFLATGNPGYDLQIEPSERAWEMISILKQSCRLPAALEMEVYSGIIGREAAVCFLSWCAEQHQRPLSAAQILNNWPEVADQARRQRHDIQAASIGDLHGFLTHHANLNRTQQDHLVAYIEVLPRDMRFGLIKSLLRIPAVAAILSEDRYDHVILDAMMHLNNEVA